MTTVLITTLEQIKSVFDALGFSPFLLEMQPVITLEGSISYTFHREGQNKVTVQVASGGTVLQDSKVVTVKGKRERQSSRRSNCQDTCYMNMQRTVSWKV